MARLTDDEIDKVIRKIQLLTNKRKITWEQEGNEESYRCENLPLVKSDNTVVPGWTGTLWVDTDRHQTFLLIGEKASSSTVLAIDGMNSPHRFTLDRLYIDIFENVHFMQSLASYQGVKSEDDIRGTQRSFYDSLSAL